MEERVQRDFFRKIKNVSGLSNRELGKLVDLKANSFGDWSRGRTSPTYTKLKYLGNRFGVKIPVNIETRCENWGQVRGGKVSQKMRKMAPEKYEGSGVLLRNKFSDPFCSKELAEFVGIVLGDGCLTGSQLQITLNSVADEKYVKYVKSLILRLFRYKAGIYKKKDSKAVVVCVTGVNFVNLMKKYGLETGDKVRNQVSVPGWIRKTKKFRKSCLRGLVDTDGGIHWHKYKIQNKQYSYLKLCFSNRSVPLRKFVFETLEMMGFNPKMAMNKHVWLYSDEESRKYLKVIGSSNFRLNRMIR